MHCKQCGSSENKFYTGRSVCNRCVILRRKVSGWKPSVVSKEKSRARNRERFRVVKEILVETRNSTCFICGCIYPNEVFDFHHLDPATKISEVSLLTHDLEIAKQEADKCIMLCANCHRMVHTGHIPKEAYA